MSHDKCPLCAAETAENLFHIDKAPIFQNKVYGSSEEAKNAVQGQVNICQCSKCGFVWNNAFDPSIMVYDGDYQNEQAHSAHFKSHLESILLKVGKLAKPRARIVEVGCGKGYFLSMLREAGYNVTGFDPAHEGNDPNVIRADFDESLEFPPADIIVLRHILEHVSDPVAFLQSIGRANQWKGHIAIEVPCFEWIIKNKAFWDIFHEHCNYFSRTSLGSLFQESTIRKIFSGQYLYMTAPLKLLRKKPKTSKHFLSASQRLFYDEIQRLREIVKNLSGCIVWGAGAKGAAFALQTDPQSLHICALVDINPKKHDKFIGVTAHKIISPKELIAMQGKQIIMNENYKDEIADIISGMRFTLHTLGDM